MSLKISAIFGRNARTFCYCSARHSIKTCAVGDDHNNPICNKQFPGCDVVITVLRFVFVYFIYRKECAND